MEILLNKMREMNRKPQRYHPKSQKFYPHPTSLRFSTTSNKQYELDNANEYLYHRIETAKGSYGPKKSLKNYEKIKYYESQILKNSRFYNPFLNYVTPHTFEKKLTKYLLNEEAKKKEQQYKNDNQNFSHSMGYSGESRDTYDDTNYYYKSYSRPVSNSRRVQSGLRSFNDRSNTSSSFNSRAFSALSRSSKKTFTIERSIPSAKAKKEGTVHSDKEKVI